MTEPKPRYRLQDSVNEVLNSTPYRLGEAFTITEMKEICTTINHESRMSEVLRHMLEHRIVESIGSGINTYMTYNALNQGYNPYPAASLGGTQSINPMLQGI